MEMNSISPAVGPANHRLLILSTAAMMVGSLSLVLANIRNCPDHGLAREATASEACALPSQIDFASLSRTTADRLANRASLCVDLETGRIDQETYTAQLAALDTPTPVIRQEERRWATEVLGSSSEYSHSNWSAQMALGPANVYPSFGDNTQAWASLTEDRKVEFLELAVPSGRIGGVEVYETFNPGAITKIELIGANGKRTQVYSGIAQATSGSNLHRVTFACTDEEVVAVRVTLNSAAVPGWNEIDAVAVTPCRSLE